MVLLLKRKQESLSLGDINENIYRWDIIYMVALTIHGKREVDG